MVEPRVVACDGATSLMVFGDDRVIRYMGEDDVVGGYGES